MVTELTNPLRRARTSSSSARTKKKNNNNNEVPARRIDVDVALHASASYCRFCLGVLWDPFLRECFNRSMSMMQAVREFWPKLWIELRIVFNEFPGSFHVDFRDGESHEHEGTRSRRTYECSNAEAEKERRRACRRSCVTRQKMV